jgi:hypothetical protein
VYFEKPGRPNTDKVIELVVGRLAEGDISTVVAASTTGYTAGKLAEALRGREGVRIVSVGESPLRFEWGSTKSGLTPERKAELEQQGVVVADHTPYLMHHSVLDSSRWKAPSAEEILRETLYAFGQGMKVAVECVLIAVATGFVEPYQDVIAVGGSSRGADTAAVIHATFPNHVFSEDEKKRLYVREILCKPR